LILKISCSKNKKEKSRDKFDLSKLPTSKIAKFHKATGDALDVLIDDMEVENARLK